MLHSNGKSVAMPPLRRESNIPSRVLSLKSTNSNLPVISKPHLFTASVASVETPCIHDQIESDVKSKGKGESNKPTRKLSLHLQSSLLPSRMRADSPFITTTKVIKRSTHTAGAQTHISGVSLYKLLFSAPRFSYLCQACPCKYSRQVSRQSTLSSAPS